MALAGKPFATTCIKSASVGGWPAAVDLYLNWPRVKSRGRGISDGAAGPLPRPSGPWHTAQRCAYTRGPSAVSAGRSAPGGQDRSAYTVGSGCQSSVGVAYARRASIDRATSSATSTTTVMSTALARERSSKLTTDNSQLTTHNSFISTLSASG